MATNGYEMMAGTDHKTVDGLWRIMMLNCNELYW